jgi:hypothetical protein
LTRKHYGDYTFYKLKDLNGGSTMTQGDFEQQHVVDTDHSDYVEDDGLGADVTQKDAVAKTAGPTVCQRVIPYHPSDTQRGPGGYYQTVTY